MSTYNTITGHLRAVSGEPPTYYVDGGAEYWAVRFANPSMVAQAPFNEPAAFTISKEPDSEGIYIIPDINKWFLLLPTAVGDETSTKKKHRALFKQVAIGTSPEGKAQAQKVVDERAYDLQCLFRKHAQHLWDVEVRGYVYESDASAAPPGYDRTAVLEFVRQNGLGGFNPNYYMVWSRFANGNWAGHGDMGGSWSVCYATADRKTFPHESGHNDGAHHASSFNHATGQFSEYGDQRIMGGALAGFSVPHWVLWGWQRDNEIVQVTTTKQVILGAVERDPHTLRDGESQTAIVQKPGSESLVLGMNKTRGWPWPSKETNAEEIVYVYDGGLIKPVLYAMVRPGKSYTHKNGVTIENLEARQETARINIYINEGDPRPKNIPFPSGFADILGGSELQESHKGLWYAKEYSGQGLELHIGQSWWDEYQESRLSGVVYFYTFDVGGRQRYYISDRFLIADGAETFRIYTTKGGTWEDPTTLEREFIGDGQLVFLSKDQGEFNFYTTEHGWQTYKFEKLAGTDTSLTGSYLHEPRAGEGYNLHLVPNSTTLAGFLYTFDEDGKQRWFELNGDIVNSRLGTFDIVDVQRGSFLYERQVTRRIAGSGHVTIVDGVADSIEFNIDTYDGLEGTYVYPNLRKLI